VIGSAILLLLLLSAVVVIVRKGRPSWITVLAVIPVAWDLAGLHASSLVPAFLHDRPVTSFEALVGLLILQAAYADGWLLPSRRVSSIDGTLLFAIYSLNILVFVWQQLIPSAAAADLSPFLHIVVVGILPIFEFRLLHALFRKFAEPKTN
jgi:hypothetical protein